MSCEHRFFSGHKPDYELCLKCDSYRSLIAPQPEEVYTGNYWSEERGHSTIHDQIHNIDVYEENGLTKSQFILDRIVCEKGSVLEVGCAPGILLRRLKEFGFRKTVGIDTAREYEPEITEISGGSTLIFGYFPEIAWCLQSRQFDLVLGIDVWEHSHKPREFVEECKRLLKPKGQLLLMSPIIEPGVEMEERMFHPVEHVWLHSRKHVEQLLSDTGFGFPQYSRWTSGHECVLARKI